MTNNKRGLLKTGPRKNILNVRYGQKLIKKLKLEKSGLSPLDVLNIIKESNLEMKNIILDNVEGYKLPHDLGYMVMSAIEKPSRRNIDYKKTAELGKTVYFTNMHGDNATLKWENYHVCKSLNIALYRFVTDRKFNIEKSKLLKNGKFYSSVPSNYFHFLTYKIKSK